MNTAELDQGASVGAVPAEVPDQTAQPEQHDAGDAHQQTDAGEVAESTASDKADEGLTEEQRTIRKQLRRIERLTAKRGAAEREAQLLREQMAEFQRQMGGLQGEDGAQSGNRQFSEADIERIATERAADIARQRAIGEKVGRVLREGTKLDGFNAAVDAVAEVVPFTDQKGKPTPFIEAVLDSDEPVALLKYLGDNPDEAEDLAALSPAQLGRRLAKLETKLASAKKQTSAAPAPIKPVAGATTVAKDEGRMTDAEWRALRFKRN